MAGLDTSHVPEFTNLLHDESHRYHVPGGRVVAAFPGGSPDFEMSIDRVGAFTAELRDKHGVDIVESLSDLKGRCDAVMLTSIDGRVHLGQFREVAGWGVPVFIDKPLTISTAEAREIADISREQGVRVMSASALRFAEAFRDALEGMGDEPRIGADFHGPMAFQDKCPGYFWYGIHSVEMLFATMGDGCRDVLAVREGAHDVIVGRWKDGRLGTVRGNRAGNNRFGGVILGESRNVAFDASAGKKPLYATLLDQLLPFFHGAAPPISTGEMTEVIAFIEAANASVTTGTWTPISPLS
jgi:hypothetical protein